MVRAGAGAGQLRGINCVTTDGGMEVWRCDTGMSSGMMSGPLEVLEILADGRVHVLTRKVRPAALLPCRYAWSDPPPAHRTCGAAAPARPHATIVPAGRRRQRVLARPSYLRGAGASASSRARPSALAPLAPRRPLARSAARASVLTGFGGAE
jgi:hypothetical protein